jgi:2-hydroxychromene-2-carboxylate isomerase
MEFYFDFLSPYSYLAFQWIKKNKVLLDSLKVPVTYRPVIMSKLIHSYDTKGPAEIESKRNFLFKDCLRYSAIHGIDFNTPKSLPFNSLYALRLVLAVEKERRFELIDAIYNAGWAMGKEIGEEGPLLEILEQADFDNSLMDQTTSKEIRRELKENGRRAIDNGVFGLPSFIYNEELFWGNDSTKYLELALANKDPMDKNKYNNFINNHPFN